jgi:hypothetical protein
MRLVILAAATALLAAPMPLAAAPAPEFSWGKPGITIEQYRLDAVQCGRKGYYRDVSNTDAAKVFKRATSMIENNEGASGWGSLQTYILSAQIVQSTQPEKRMAEVRVYLEEAVITCLTGRGYTRFRLTKEQRARLGRLHLGSPERHAFMFSLASDPEVLAKQAVA